MALQVGELYQTLTIDDSGFDKSMKGAEKQSSGLAKILKIGIGGAAVAAGAALVGMAKNGLDNMRELDDATTGFKVATGSSAEEAERFSDTLQKLHKVNTDSYEELGEAVTALRQRHGDLGDDMGPVSQQFLDFAKVTGQDTVNAMEDVSDTLARFNLDLDEAPGLMDSMKVASEETGIPLEELQSGLKNAGTQFNALGYDVDESIAMLSSFHKAGVDASTAQRGLNRAIKSALDDDLTVDKAKAFRQLGVELEENFYVAKNTESAFAELGYEVREGTELTEDMIKVARENGIEMELQSKVAGTAKESLEEMFEAMSDGEMTTEDINAAMEILGTRAGPDMIAAMQEGNLGIEEMMKTLSESEGAVASASEAYDKQLGERWTLIKRKYLHPFMETLGETLLNLLEKLLDFAEEWGPKVSAVFEKMTNLISGLFTNMSGDTESTWNNILDSVKQYTELIQELISVFVDLAIKFWDEFGEDIVDVAKLYFEQASDAIDTVLKTITGIIDAFIGLITGDWKRMGDAIEGIWDDWTGFIVRTAERLWGLIEEPFNKVRDGVVNIFQGVSDTVTDMFDGIVDTIKSVINGAIGMINSAIGGINSMIETANDLPGINIPTIKEIPKLAEGGTALSGGAALVGEEGPELLNMPRGARVTPLPGENSATRTANITFELDGRTVARVVEQPLADRLRIKGGMKI